MPNKFKLNYTPLSKADLIDIFDYIADDNIDAALDFVEKIEQSIKNLSIYPFSGSIPPDVQLRLKGYRLIFIGRYSVFYKPNDNTKSITIYRILSTYRDYEDLLE